MTPSDPFFGFDDNDRTVIRPTPGGRKSDVSVTYVVSPDMSEQQASFVVLSGDNPWVGHAYALLSLVPKLRHLPYLNAVNELRERLIRALTQFENSTMNQGIAKNQVNIAKFFLCTLLDEAVLNTPWGSQSGWGHNSLSSTFFKKLSGGEEFFQILDKLRQQPSQNQNLLELALLCLNLGFEGKFRYMKNGQQALENLRQEIYQSIRAIKGDAPPELSSHWRGITAESNPLARYVPLWVIAGVVCVVLMVIYIGFAVSIRNYSDDIFGKLSAIAQGIEKTPPIHTEYPAPAPKISTALGSQFRALLADDIASHHIEVVGDSKLRLYNMFPSGNAEVLSEYQSILAKIAGILRKEDVRALITGHTDSQKLNFSSRYQSNWELSLARAANTAKALNNYGVPMENMRFEGMADKEPIVPDTTQENQALNRRIEIIIR